MKIIATMTNKEAAASIETMKNVTAPFCKKDINAEIGKGIRKSGNKYCHIIETIDDDGNVNTEMNIDPEYFATCLKVVEVFSQDFAPEIMATITKIVMMVKGVQENLLSCKIKHFQEKAKKILDPFTKDESMYAVTQVHDLEPIGIHAAAVVEDNGFCRRVVHTICSGDRSAMDFINSIVEKMDLDKMELNFAFSKDRAVDLAEGYIDDKIHEAHEAINVDNTAITDIKPGEKDEEDDKYIFNGVRGGMRLDDDVAAEFIVE